MAPGRLQAVLDLALAASSSLRAGIASAKSYASLSSAWLLRIKLGVRRVFMEN